MLRLSILVLFVAGAACATGPMTPRQQLIVDTAGYTKCDHVQVDCVDEMCSNVQGGPWTATACGTKYRCTRTGEHMACTPINDQALP